MLLEKLFLSFCLVEKKISGPVSGCQSSESFLQVIMFLEALNELLQLFLSSLNWSKSATTHWWEKAKTNLKIWEEKKKSNLKSIYVLTLTQMILYGCKNASRLSFQCDYSADLVFILWVWKPKYGSRMRLVVRSSFSHNSLAVIPEEGT